MKEIVNKILNLSAIFLSGLLVADPKIVKLEPPVFSEATIESSVICTRPMRDGMFNISTEEIGSKKIVNIYGHGGSGLTTLFGSVYRAIDLFEQKYQGTTKPIRIIGSGCMGLTAAIELMRKGYNVAGITTKNLYDITSWRAGGYFALVSIQTAPEEEAALEKIGSDTFKAYQDIEKGIHPYIHSNTVRYMPTYSSADTENGVEGLEKAGEIPPFQDVTLDFGNGTTHPNFVEFYTYYMDPSHLMQQLWDEVNRLGVPVEIAEVQSFDDVGEEIIFNCSGLGGRELNNDDKMIAVRGHLFLLNDQAGKGHMDYMIYTAVPQDGHKEYIYMFPRISAVTAENPEGVSVNGVLGGTFIKNADKLSPEESSQLNETEFQKMKERCAIFFYGKSWAELNN